ncbi:MAG: hypothetical protein QM756_17525 [Polyangiaceae bacterium]
MSKRPLLMISFATVCFGAASTAEAALPLGEFKIHGSGCVSGGSDAYYVFPGQWGKQNNSTNSERSVYCSLGYGVVSSQTPHVVDAWVYDRNPTKDIVCTAYQVGRYGNVLWTQAQQTQSSAAGPMHLTWTPPTLPDTVAMFMKCTLPRVSGGQYSHLTTISGH